MSIVNNFVNIENRDTVVIALTFVVAVIGLASVVLPAAIVDGEVHTSFAEETTGAVVALRVITILCSAVAMVAGVCASFIPNIKIALKVNITALGICILGAIVNLVGGILLAVAYEGITIAFIPLIVILALSVYCAYRLYVDLKPENRLYEVEKMFE